MDKGECVVCGHFSLSNDAHHLFYRKNWKDTEITELVTLCRKCHENVHDLGADVLCKKLWDERDCKYEKVHPLACQVCRAKGLPLVPMIGRTGFNGNSEKRLPWLCGECKKEFVTRWKVPDEDKKRNPWKIYGAMRKAHHIVRLRAFHAENLRRILRTGIERNDERLVFMRICRKISNKILRIFPVDSSQLTT